MYSIVFATTNNGKVQSMRKWVEPYGLKVYKHKKKKDFESFDEAQEATLEEIAIKKAIHFKKIINKPLVVQDSGFYIKEMKTFPGHLVKPVLQEVGLEGLLKFVPEYNRGCYFKDVLAFWSPDYEKLFPKEAIKIFTGEVHGYVAKKPSTSKRNEMWSPLWTIFIPEGFNVTLAEMDQNEQQRFADNHRSNPDKNCFLKFVNWLKTNSHYAFYSQGKFEF